MMIGQFIYCGIGDKETLDFTICMEISVFFCPVFIFYFDTTAF